MLGLKEWTSWLFICFAILIVMWVFFGKRDSITESVRELDDKHHVFDSPMLPHLPRWMGDKPIKSPFLMDDVIESVKEREHPINCVPKLPEGLVEIKPTEAKMPPKKRMDSKGEAACRAILEDIFNKPFPKIKPGFIRNPETHALLELDGYNCDIGIAFEYNGIQHYTWPNYTNQTYDDFKSQVRRDQYKIECCDRHNVYLITIPHVVPFSDLRKFIEYYLPENVAKRLKNNESGG